MILRDRHQGPTLVLSDYFDLIVGTSTGAIIASLLGTGPDTDEVASLYADLGRQIFSRRQGVAGRLASRFEAEPLEAALRSALGENSLGTGLPGVKTGLCIIVKRADTQSTWPLINHPMQHWTTDMAGNLISLIRPGKTAANGCGTFYNTPSNTNLRAVAQYNTAPVNFHYSRYQGVSPLIALPGAGTAHVGTGYVYYAWSI